MPRPKGPPTRRLNLVLNTQVFELIEKIQKKIHADSKSEVVRRALKKYAEILEQKEKRKYPLTPCKSRGTSSK